MTSVFPTVTLRTFAASSKRLPEKRLSKERLSTKHLLKIAVVALFGLTACQDGLPGTSSAGPVGSRSELSQPPSEPLRVADVALPARAAFYYPWYPETWQVGGTPVAVLPALGRYRSDDPAVIDAHIRALDYAGVAVAIASWWGPGTHDEAARLPRLLARTRSLGSPLKWAVYYEAEGYGDPSPAELRAALAYLSRYFGPNYAFVEGKPVVFVYSADDADCTVASRWRAATAGYTELHVVLKVFPGYRECAEQPSGWHQYGPAEAADRQAGFSSSVSPGFWRADEAAPRLSRDLGRWRRDVRAMVEADDPWQLVTTFNEWGEGTAVEAGGAWTGGEYGPFLEVLAHHKTDTLTGTPTDALTGTPGVVAGTGPPERKPVAVGDSVTVAAVGDIACDPASRHFAGGFGTDDNCRQHHVAELVAALDPDALLPLGDVQYEEGSAAQFRASYDLSFGRFKAFTYPAVGNHEYLTRDAADYFNYFGPQAGDPAKGYYSFELGAWHLIALNSNCSKVGGCEAGSPQERWLRADLAAHPNRCTLAYWHHPRFSSGRHGNDDELSAFWDALYDAGAELALAGHDHLYERFAPQTADGTADPGRGVRGFVVGTGGKNHTEVAAIQPHSEFRQSGVYGLLELTLSGERYDWRFVPEGGDAVVESGGDVCH